MLAINGRKSFNVNKPPDDACKKGSSKWWCRTRRNRLLPVVFCVICFTGLFSWVLMDIFTKPSAVVFSGSGPNETGEAIVFSEDDIEGKGEVLDAKELSCTLTTECNIVCKGMAVNVMSEEITGILENESCETIILSIDTLHTDDNKLFRGWLNLDVDINVDQLELKRSEITEIPPESFDAGCLFGSSILTLDSLQITHLNANVFLGLFQLKELNLKNLPLTVVEPFVLAPVKFTLTSLLVEGCLDMLNPRAFTGSSTVDNLAIVSFQFNIFEDVISDDALAMVPKLSSLYLGKSHITTLNKGMIDSISRSVKQIHLVGNALSTVEEGVFDSLVGKGVKVHLKDNPWKCDCELSYLQELIVSNPDMFDEVQCEEPVEFSGQLVAAVDVCGTSTTETIITETTLEQTSKETDPTETTETTDYTPHTKPTFKPTGTPSAKPTDASEPTESGTTSTSSVSPTSPSPITTTQSTDTTTFTIPPNSTYAPTFPPVENGLAMQCMSTAVPLNSSITTYQGSQLNIRKRTITFSIFEAQEGSVEVILDKSYPNAMILWFYDPSTSNSMFTMNIEDSANCADIYGRTVRITNLIPDKNYLFCVILRHEMTVSPFDCLPHKLLPIYGQRCWLIEDHKIIIISILLSSILVALLTGVIVTYCFLKSFATYQKACRKVTTDLRIDQSTTNQCYMSPVIEQKDRGNGTFRAAVKGSSDRQQREDDSSLDIERHHKRSVSDTSLDSCRSYVSAVVPATQFQYISWKMENRSRGQMECYPKDPPPPPLPPHPSKRLKKQQSEVKINFREIYDEPSSSYTSGTPGKQYPGKH